MLRELCEREHVTMGCGLSLSNRCRAAHVRECIQCCNTEFATVQKLLDTYYEKYVNLFRQLDDEQENESGIIRILTNENE